MDAHLFPEYVIVHYYNVRANEISYDLELKSYPQLQYPLGAELI